MNEKMQVLYVEHTGHVLGAISRTSDPEGELDAEALAGGGLVVDTVDSATAELRHFEVPAATLKTSSVSFDPAVFSEPREYLAQAGAVSRASIDITAGTLPDLSTAALKISNPSADPVPKDGIQVFAVIESDLGDAGLRRVVAGKLEKDDTDVTLGLTVLPGEAAATLESGDYHLLVLVGGYLPYVYKETL